MNYRSKITYILVKKLGFSFKEAQKAIDEHRVQLNGKTVVENTFVGIYDTLLVDKQLVQAESNYVYVAYYKPRGIECTLAPHIENGLYHHLPDTLKGLVYAGRLDKESEGLLLLTNDGHVYNKIIHPSHKVEKYYEVSLEKVYDETFLIKMSEGVMVNGQKTLPCKVLALNENSFGIILQQGLNRQIRKMCFALGNYVTHLKRYRIGEISLRDLNAGNYKNLSQEEITFLRNL